MNENLYKYTRNTKKQLTEQGTNRHSRCVTQQSIMSMTCLVGVTTLRASHNASCLDSISRMMKLRRCRRSMCRPAACVITCTEIWRVVSDLATS